MFDVGDRVVALPNGYEDYGIEVGTIGTVKVVIDHYLDDPQVPLPDPIAWVYKVEWEGVALSNDPIAEAIGLPGAEEVGWNMLSYELDKYDI